MTRGRLQYCWLLWTVAVMVVVSEEVIASPNNNNNNYRTLTHHQVWKAEGSQVMEIVAGLETEGLVDILGHSSSVPKFRVAPDSRASVSAALTQAGINYQVLIHDLASHIKEEQRASLEGSARRVRQEESCTEDSCPKPLTQNYMTFQQIEWYLKELAATSSRVTLESIGKSIEGRDIWRVHIKPTATEDATIETRDIQRAVWFEGGIHAREWISPAVTLNLIHKIVADKSITQKMDVHVVPMANPDGYEYTWTNDRLWRKNRRPNNQRPSCSGVDLNRNWDVGYGVGASSNPCSEVYKGTEAFSEPETKAMRDDVLKIASEGNLRLVLSLHSYGQVLLYPWGYTADPAPDTSLMERAGNLFARAAKRRYKTNYRVVNSATGFYYASGTTDDWAKATLEAPLVYTLELRDTGADGFVLPSDQILPTANEVWKGVKRMLKFIHKKQL